MERIDLRSERSTLAELAYQHLLSAIMSHALKPGDKLRPDTLAAGMGISSTPVMEALARLAGEGLVDPGGGLGTRVAVLANEDLLLLYDCRLMCELHAVREGIATVDAAFLAHAQDLLNAHDAASLADNRTYEGRRRVAELDTAFHLHVVSLWPNPRTLSWYTQLNIHMRAHRISVLLDKEARQSRNDEIIRQHWAIYAAVERRDVEAALAAVRDHIAFAKQRMISLGQVVDESPSGDDGLRR
jgi:DNA-binding GntR family transcriptional regulator